MQDFLNLDSLNFVQFVFGPTHKHTGSCPLIQFGMPVSNLEICDTMFSDHMSVSCEVGLSCAILKTHTHVRRCWLFNPFTADQFSAVFDPFCGDSVDPEELSAWFTSSCKTILDSVAPLKMKQPKVRSDKPGLMTGVPMS